MLKMDGEAGIVMAGGNNHGSHRGVTVIIPMIPRSGPEANCRRFCLKFIQGWYLFIDSGLDVMERNVLQAELRGDFKVQAVEDVLRKHWHDADLRRRDSEKGKFMSNLAELDGEDPEWACLGEWDPEQLEAEGYSLDEIEAMAVEQETQKEALVAFQEAKRTLKEARARQHAVKTSRQFYSVKSRMSATGGKGSGRDGPIKCFRCGGPHKVAQCPEKPKESANVSIPEESAPFVFLAEAEEDTEESALMSTESQTTSPPTLTTAQVVEEGKAVLDGGATRSIGSIYALSKVLELNEARRGVDGLKELDMEDRPSFGFGNSSRDRCASTASLAVPWNGSEKVLKVHALDKGTSPILMSIHSLRRLGAIVDFECDKSSVPSCGSTKSGGSWNALLPDTRCYLSQKMLLKMHRSWSTRCQLLMTLARGQLLSARNPAAGRKGVSVGAGTGGCEQQFSFLEKIPKKEIGPSDSLLAGAVSDGRTNQQERPQERKTLNAFETHWRKTGSQCSSSVRHAGTSSSVVCGESLSLQNQKCHDLSEPCGGVVKCKFPRQAVGRFRFRHDEEFPTCHRWKS